MQNQTNSNKIMNKNQKNNIKTILKIWEIIYKIIRKSDTIRTQIMKSWDTINWESHIRKTTDISIIIRKITRAKKYLNSNLWREYIWYFMNNFSYFQYCYDINFFISVHDSVWVCLILHLQFFIMTFFYFQSTFKLCYCSQFIFNIILCSDIFILLNIICF